MKASARSSLLAASFLMATAAIGPGFLTQTAIFTQELLVSFSAVILLSVLVDLVVQLNIWQILFLRQQTAGEVADKVLPGLGKLLTLFIAVGGFAFNIGNLAGAGLGLSAATGWPVTLCTLLSAGAIFVVLFQGRNALTLMDQAVKWMGLLMLCLTAYMALQSAPPLKELASESFFPTRFNPMALLTIVGGTVGGYISFAGAHRLLERKDKEPLSLPAVRKSASLGILTASLMRYLLFLAALGVVVKGQLLDASNPAASVFQYAGGAAGFRLFGIVMWCAAVTSVFGSAYTTISFAKPYWSFLQQKPETGALFFIAGSLVVFLIWGKPVELLVGAGLINGCILPAALVILLIAAGQKKYGNQPGLYWRVLGWLIAVLLTVTTIQVLLQN